MKTSAIICLLAAITTTSGSPLKTRNDQVEITFIGAADAQFTQSFPSDGTVVSIGDPLSISHISSNTAGIQCTFNGVDHSVTTVNGAELVDVGPPQTQVSASCHAIGSPPTPNSPVEHQNNDVQVTFIGAANALFTQVFPINGGSVQITNPLSISHIVSDRDGVTCVFNGIDHSVTTITGTQLVDVGPPQTQISGSCRM
ncbi:uncharacterized protein N7446_006388 [Penicillium canescens]|uniref:Uncharacterized protein n=1 Tax=Penicillium canescens TaxID=5083 RepID=A0AAD6IJL1_PENCN|nr:uncharacterized protein N7446_006388 [Penicillium canescens]KAJ6051753.1 hypothetical protein N7460_002287 [Penicillium canescens]KAJ6062268.1 hypothetical protein N7446_006388 [Penicillium canescens]KAJ6065515.1 hypothetical protein N7444_001168 [Penicillium canescens]